MFYLARPSMQLGVWGSAVSSPSGSGRRAAAKRQLVHFWSENALSGKTLASENVCLVKFYHESGRLRRTGMLFRSHLNTVCSSNSLQDMTGVPNLQLGSLRPSDAPIAEKLSCPKSVLHPVNVCKMSTFWL